MSYAELVIREIDRPLNVVGVLRNSSPCACTLTYDENIGYAHDQARKYGTTATAELRTKVYAKWWIMVPST